MQRMIYDGDATLRRGVALVTPGVPFEVEDTEVESLALRYGCRIVATNADGDAPPKKAPAKRARE